VVTFKEFKAMRKGLGISKSSKEILSGFQEIYKFNITDDLTKRASNLMERSVPMTQPYKEDHISFLDQAGPSCTITQSCIVVVLIIPKSAPVQRQQTNSLEASPSEDLSIPDS